MVDVSSDKIRGAKSGLLAAASDGELHNYRTNLRAGMTEDRCLEILADEVALNRHSGEGIGAFQQPDVRAKR